MVSKTVIIGVGLLGASVALGLREKGLSETVLGCGRNEGNLRAARERGIIDDYSLDAASVCAGAELVILATPVGAFRAIASAIPGSLRPDAIITDVGSVKGRLVSEMEDLIGGSARYVGGHPIAGGDRAGIEDARAGLFAEARCLLTPTERSDRTAVALVRRLWEALGCRVEEMDPFEHDEIYGAVSHLPHIVAYSLVNTADAVRPGSVAFAGQGFKDTTRIALSSPELWRDIAMANADNLVRALGLMRAELLKMEALLASGKADELEQTFSRARQLRSGLVQSGRASAGGD
jgi:prephenate dehydrogenase